jgi:hypothetical protein
MKKLVVILFLCLMTFSSYCRDTSIKRDTIINKIRKNSIFFELGGNGLFYSINYERLIPISEDRIIGLRVGYAYCEMSFTSIEKYSIVPLEINLISGKKHCFEIGCGLTMSKYTKGEIRGSYSKPILTSERIETLIFRTGYRYRADSGFLFRIAPLLMFYSPIQLKENKRNFWIGISVGSSF